MGGAWVGAVAAGFYATAPLVVVTAHDFKQDVPLAFWQTVQIFFLSRFLGAGRGRDFVLAAAAVGFAAGTKYTGAAAIAVNLAAALGRREQIPWRTWAWAAIAMAGAFLICSPTLVLDGDQAWADLRFELAHAREGHRGIGVGPIAISPLTWGWTYHLRESLIPGISGPGVALAVLGVCVAATLRDPSWRLVGFAFGFFYLLLESLPLKPPPFPARYMVAVVPYAALLIGGAVGWSRRGSRMRAALVGGIAAVTILANGIESARQVEAMTPDTRDLARDWIRNSLPPGSTLMAAGAKHYLDFSDPDRARAVERMEILGAGSALPAGPRAVYVLSSSFYYDRYLEHPEVAPEHTDLFRRLESIEPLVTFRPARSSIGLHNPTIRIHRFGGPEGAPR